MPTSWSATIPAPDGSLAAVHPGERVVVQQIFFDAVRDCCSTQGVVPGSALRCERVTSGSVFVRDDRGEPHALDRLSAGFVLVRPLRGPDDRMRM